MTLAYPLDQVLGRIAPIRGLKLRRARERRLHVLDDVVGADMFDEFRLVKELCRLLPRAAQDQRSARLLQPIAQRFERRQPGRVDRGHVAQTQNHDRCEMRQIGRRVAACQSSRRETAHECGGS
jgi:hypothetical protein